MRKFFKLDNQGFTLTEIIVTLAISSIVLVAIATFFVNNMRFNAMAQDEVYIQDQVRYATKGITKLAMEQKSVTTSVPGVDGVSYIATFVGGPSGQLIIKLLENGDLMYNNNGSGDKVLAKNIIEFTVEEDATNERLIKVTLKGEKGDAVTEAVEQIYLRNK